MSVTPMLLPYVPPWDWRQFQEHFALRHLPGLERVTAEGYRRSVRCGQACGWFEVRPLADRPALALTLSDALSGLATPLAARVSTMFDLETDPAVLVRHFADDPVLGPRVAAQAHLRLPAAFDPFEQAVRAIIGQQVSVKAATSITRRLVERLGDPFAAPDAPELNRLFPTPDALAGASLTNLGMPARRLAALQHFAAAVAEGTLRLEIGAGATALVNTLCALPGIGPWTAWYIALRGFGEPDAFPAADLGLLKSPVWGQTALTPRQLAARAERWRPYRAYAAIHLWHAYAES